MDNLEILMQSLSQIMLPADVCPRKSDLAQRIILIKAGIHPYSALWGDIHPTFIFENATDPKKINMVLSGNEDAANKLLSFIKDKCDPNAISTPNNDHYTITIDFELMKTQFIPYLQNVINAMVIENVPALTPHRYLSEFEPLVLKKRFKNTTGINDPNNPFGLVMKEIDDNLAKLGLSICYSQLMDYSLMLMAGERDKDFETSHSRTWPIQYLKNGDGPFIVDRGWGFYYYYQILLGAPENYIYFRPENNGNNVIFDVSLDKGDRVEKLGSLLQSLCEVEISRNVNCYRSLGRNVAYPIGDNYAYAIFTISTKDYYEKVLPKFKEFINRMINSEFPDLYDTLKVISKNDPDVQRLQNVEDKTWQSIPINFPKIEKKPKPETEPSKKSHHHGFFHHAVARIKEVLHDADCCVSEHRPV